MPVPPPPSSARRPAAVRAALAVVVALTGGLGGVVASAAPASADELRSPLDPLSVGRRFDPPRQRWGAGHRGVDLVGVAGQRVLAAAPGRVSFAGRIAGRGVVVVVHGGVRTTYEPVTPTVAAGDRVAAGEPIARLDRGHLGCPVPLSCLHWGALRGETYLDPLALLRVPPLRLLPLGPPAATGGVVPAFDRAAAQRGAAHAGALPARPRESAAPAPVVPASGRGPSTATTAAVSLVGGALAATAVSALRGARRRPALVVALPAPHEPPPSAAPSVVHLRRVA